MKAAPPPELAPLLTVLQIVAQKGGTDCTGGCHHRQPGEFHCQNVARLAGLSSQGVKNRILELLRLGLLRRQRIHRDSGVSFIKFVPTDKGRRVLSELGPTIQKVEGV